jgi:hypothetical protein
MLLWSEAKTQLREAVRQTAETDLRWSYVIVGALALLGVAVNLLLPHGWTVWPVVLAVGLLVMVNEAADRNGQGVPPLAVYAAFVGAVVLWLGVLIIISAVHPLILLLALAVLGYQCGRGYMKVRAQRQLVDQRRAQGLCVHCGEANELEQIYCGNCGEVANPDGVRARWSTLNPRNGADVARVRAALKPESPATTARMKEQALLNRRHRPHARKQR